MLLTQKISIQWAPHEQFGNTANAENDMLFEISTNKHSSQINYSQDVLQIEPSHTIGKTYKLTVEGNTTSSGFTFGSANGVGNEYGSGSGTHYFTALHAKLWVRQTTAGTTNIPSFRFVTSK